MTIYTDDARLVSLYRLDNNWTDTVGNNDLTPTNSPTFNASDKQQGTHSADFEASSSQSASISDAGQTGLDITGNITICFWLKPESVSSPEYQIVSKYRTGDNNRSYRVVIDGGSPFGIRANLSNNGSAVVAARSATAIQAGVWQHIAVVYNGTDIRIYLDGVLDSNGALNPLTYSSGIFNGGAAFYLGLQDGSTSYYDGLLDEVAIFNDALSAAEVGEIYADGIDDPPEPEPEPSTSTITFRAPRGLGSPKFELWLTSDKGVRLAQLSTAVAFSGSKVAGGIGEFWYQPTSSFDLTLLKPDNMVQFWYEPWGGDKFLFNIYFLRNFRYKSRSIEFGGPDINSLLTRRIVAAKSNSAQSKKAAMATDDMMKEFVAESLLDSADPIPDFGTRAWANLTVQGDSSQGPTISDSFPFKKLLTFDGGGVLPILAKQAKERGTEVFYGIRPNVIGRNDITFIFYTKINFPGSDVSDFVTFDEASGNLLEPDLVMDYTNEANYIYATGQGEESQRYVKQVWDEARVNQSIWGRIEAEADSRNLSQPLEVENNGYMALWDGRPKIRFTGKPGDTEGVRYGVHWNFGDLVRTKFKFIDFRSIIRAVTLSVDDKGKYAIDARLDYES